MIESRPVFVGRLIIGSHAGPECFTLLLLSCDHWFCWKFKQINHYIHTFIKLQDDGGDDDGSDANMDQDEGQGNDDDGHEQEPQTREEMREIQARFKNNRKTAAYFYHQRYVQIEMRMTYLGAQPLFEEFQEALEKQKMDKSLGCYRWGPLWLL